MKVCEVEGCKRKARARKLCWRHLQQIDKYGEIRGPVERTMFDPNKFIIKLEPGS